MAKTYGRKKPPTLHTSVMLSIKINIFQDLDNKFQSLTFMDSDQTLEFENYKAERKEILETLSLLLDSNSTDPFYQLPPALLNYFTNLTDEQRCNNEQIFTANLEANPILKKKYLAIEDALNYYIGLKVLTQ